MKRKLMRLFINLAIFFAWKTVIDTGIWVYEENEITRKRRCFRKFNSRHVYQPCDMRWVMGADVKPEKWPQMGPPPPSKNH